MENISGTVYVKRANGRRVACLSFSGKPMLIEVMDYYKHIHFKNLISKHYFLSVIFS